MSFPTDPTNLDTFQTYLFENNEWKKRMVAEQGDDWIKFHNGIMIVYGNELTDSGSGNVDITWPQPFIEEPIVVADTPRSSYFCSTGGSDVQPTTIGCSFRIRGASVSYDGSVTTGPAVWMAAGLWKTFEPYSIDMTQTKLGSRIYDTTKDAYVKIPSIQAGAGVNGYWIEFDDGVMIQFGKEDCATLDVISYPRTFSSEPTVLTDIARTGIRCMNGTGNTNPTVSNFIVYQRDITTNTNYTGNSIMHWFAFGEI